MTLTLQKAEPIDYPEIVALVNRAYRGNGDGWNNEGGLFDGDRTSLERLENDIHTTPHATLLLYRANGKVTASVWLEQQADRKWYLGMLSVEPTQQGSGLGREVLSATEDFVARHGGGVIVMTVIDRRDTLIAWYERRGYKRTGETRPFPALPERGRPLEENLHFCYLAKTINAIDRDQSR